MPECAENGKSGSESDFTNEGEIFLFTSESVGEGHPGMSYQLKNK